MRDLYATKIRILLKRRERRETDTLGNQSIRDERWIELVSTQRRPITYRPEGSRHRSCESSVSVR